MDSVNLFIKPYGIIILKALEIAEVLELKIEWEKIAH
jgi:hypothetical protein